MAVETSLPALLDTLTQSLSSATESIPESSTIIPPEEGISLLDVKNELLLSYLQHLVFLIILKLRDRRVGSQAQADQQIVKKLVELRLYLEKGVRPLEGRLKYQIDKVLRAADDAARSSGVANGIVKKQIGESANDSSNESAGEEDSDEGDKESEDGDESGPDASDIDDLQYRPNPSALARPTSGAADSSKSADGVYRPPRIAATAMPTTEGRKEREDQRPQKSAVLDEFISTELSTAPLAMPSIGSSIVAGGRKMKSERQRVAEAERREYEETNFVRLPKESKKDRAKNKGNRPRDAGYGGEEWRDLGAGLDRIDKLTKRKGGADARSVLERSRKRAVEDGPRDSGSTDIGQRFQKRLKTIETGRKNRGRK